jgi:hypothetical protein
LDKLLEEGGISNGQDQASTFDEYRPVRTLEPRLYNGLSYFEDDFSLLKDDFKFLNGKEWKLQVVIKLTNIYLTPDKTQYLGEIWSFNGQLNEHIIASLTYCYESRNLSDLRISFRVKVPLDFLEEEVPHSGYLPEDIEKLFGIRDEEPNLQDLGYVSCCEGRLVTYPNGLQHHTGKLELTDPSKPGHCKLVTLFLIDPDIPIIFTSNIPPQQREWSQSGGLPGLTREVAKESTIEVKEALKLRDEMLLERVRMDRDVDLNYADQDFNFENFP